MRTKLYRILLLLSIAGYGWLGWNIVDEADRSSLPSVCLFKDVTGLPCPSCGTTRALVLLVHGRVYDSFMTNPFGAFLALVLAVIPLWIAVDVGRNSDSFYRRYRWVEHLFIQHKWISLCAAGVVVLNWIWNIAKRV